MANYFVSFLFLISWRRREKNFHAETNCVIPSTSVMQKKKHKYCAKLEFPSKQIASRIFSVTIGTSVSCNLR